MKPLYVPKGKAKEYGDYAVNIYTGCPHRCYYCFAPTVLRKDREKFHSYVEPRPGIVEALKSQLQREQITGQTIHLCFTCDPYPTGYDTTVTREVITAIKDSGNHVQILTKGIGVRDFDLLDTQDWFGVTIDGWNRNNYSVLQLRIAHSRGIKTWISFEPVLEREIVLQEIMDAAWYGYADKIKIGKLNYHQSTINWKQFGEEVNELCKELGLDYYIKESLRKEMTSNG